jgi:hypothetical protein
VTYEAHPYALMLPPLTGEEYGALKADIDEHGILYPVILDEGDRVLDGVHRVRIAAELGIDPPVSRHTGLDDERKLHLAVGLNMRRRHLDADRRRDLVRKLHDEQELSVRTIASITGWSKSTVDRDLKTSPFEIVVASTTTALTRLREKIADAPAGAEAARDTGLWIVDGMEACREMFGWADGQWKRGSWPPDVVEHCLVSLEMYTLGRTIERLIAALTGDALPPEPVEWRPKWDSITPERRREFAERLRNKGMLFGPPSVPSGTPT